MLVEQADHVEALLGGDQRAAVALDVADVDQALDDRGARGRRADAGVLHRLAQLVVVDELARGLHRGQQRRVGVAARRLGDLLLRGDLARVDGLAALELRELLRAALVVVGGRLRARRRAPPRRRRRASRPRAARGRACGRRARRRSSPGACSRTRPRDGRRRGSGGRPCRRSRRSSSDILSSLWSRVGRDDRVVVGDLRVVDHAVGRQHVEPGHVRGRLARTRGASPTWPAIGLISPTMSDGRKREFVRG